MKIYTRIIIAVSAIVAAAAIVASCSGKNSGESNSIEFPEMQTLSVQPDQEQTLSFNAGASWQLTSSALWLKFVDSGIELYDISGKAGSQSVTLRVKSDGQGFDSDRAEVTLSMGGTKKVIAEVIREAKSYAVKITDLEGNELKEINISYDDYSYFRVETNFEYTTEEIDEVDFKTPVTGESGKVLETGAMILEDYITHPITKDDNVNLVFYNSEKEAVASYPIIYKGIDDTFIRVKERSGTGWEMSTLYQYELSLDGKTFRSGLGKYNYGGSIVDGSFNEVSGSVQYKVIALNDSFKFITIEADEKGEIVRPATEWLHGTVDSSNPMLVNITADASTKMRTGCIFAVPDGTYQTINSELKNGANYQTLKIKYRDNLILEACQQDHSALLFDIRDCQRDWNRLHSYTVVTDASELSFCKTNFGVETVAQIYINVNTSVMICPLYMETNKEEKTNYKSYMIYKTDGTEDEDLMVSGKGSEETYYDDWYMYYVNVHPIPATKDAFYVVFRTQSGDNEKALKVIVKK